MRPHALAIAAATLGGLGRIPCAPGTWGSAVGLLFGVLLARGSRGSALLVLLGVGFILCALICTEAERRLGQHDPSAVILDEAWAMCVIVVALRWAISSFPSLLAAFTLFRIFDIVKPPPLKQLARLPAGWGIMADDLGAAAYTVLALWVLTRIAGVVHSP